MNWLKQNWVEISLAALILILGILIDIQTNNPPLRIYKSNNAEVLLSASENIINDAISVDLADSQQELTDEQKYQAYIDNQPPITEEQAYQHPLVQFIRTSLQEHLNGGNRGIWEDAITGKWLQDKAQCGLANFDKAYYKSKFIIYSSKSIILGGRVTNIVFIDKPDAIFEAWVYGHPWEDDEYSLRLFCKVGPPDDIQADFTMLMNELIEEGLRYAI